jgi:GntR family transcriptional regulator/MocR family aminotransferase
VHTNFNARRVCVPRTLVEIDRESDEPLYRQVRLAIEHGIAMGTFDLHHRLPSSRELAVELAVSRNTINLAYQELIAEGLVLSHERRGLFVNPAMREACEVQAHNTASKIDWARRIRRYGDADVPHVQKQIDWHRYPYPFVAGQVDVHAFPARAWIRCLREALYQPHVFPSLQDSVGADDPMLVEQIRKHLLPARGVEAAPEEILITVGSQQGLDLLGRVLLGRGDTVAMENPGYLDARHIFLRTGASVRPIDVDERGLRPPETLDGVDLMYLTPSHHHPTNVTLSMDRRLRLLQLAAEAGTILVEDDYDSEFRYQGSPSPALKALDATGDGVYLGTFSKFLSPGLRLGYLVGPAELIRELREVRRYVLRHPPGHQQRALALLIDSGEYHRALRRQRGKLRRKWELLGAATNTHLPWTQSRYPPGGVSLWMTGPPELDATELVRRAQRRGVLIEPGDVYYHGAQTPRNHFRIGFAAVPMRVIDDGIAILGQECAALLSGDE